MKKILIILSSSIMSTSLLNNLNLVTKINIKQDKTFISNQSSNDDTILQKWHNSITLAQDKLVKQSYLDSMIITTSKTSDSNLDNYIIKFDDNKLKDMLNKKLINQDVYNIWSSSNYANELMYKANAIGQIMINNKIVKFRKYQYEFYIENNKMYFVDKNHPNPHLVNINLKSSSIAASPQSFSPTINSSTIQTIGYWWENNLRVKLQSDLISFLNKKASEVGADATESDLLKFTAEWVEKLEATEGFEWTSSEFEFFSLLLDGIGEAAFIAKPSAVAKLICDNLSAINKANDKYKSGAEFKITWNLSSDSNENNKYILSDISPIPPINKFTSIDDKEPAEDLYKGRTRVNEYDFDSLVSYSKYNNLWVFLNSSAIFNLQKRFESSVGLISPYKSYNDTFNKSESVSILKPYLNNWVTLTDAFWKTSSPAYSSAELDMEIKDNPWNKTIYFNFKSLLRNDNTFESVENWMY